MHQRLAFLVFLATASVMAAPAVPAPVDPPTVITNTIGMTLIRLPAGYWVGKYEVTQEEFEKILNYNPSRSINPKYPVENVSWNESVIFCDKLTELEKNAGKLPSGYVYRLPSEKEWEYYVADAQLKDAVNSLSRPDDQIRQHEERVGSLGPNEFGLFDVRGNVWEWCLERYPSLQDCRILRGGSYATTEPEAWETSYRNVFVAETRYWTFGFRCLLAPPLTVNPKPQ